MKNNVNNNFYTNYIAKWCIDYTYEQLQKFHWNFLHKRIIEKTKLADSELKEWKV
jgi:maltose phosphorylase